MNTNKFKIYDEVRIESDMLAEPVIKYRDGEVGFILDIVAGTVSEGYSYIIVFEFDDQEFFITVPERYLVLISSCDDQTLGIVLDLYELVDYTEECVDLSNDYISINPKFLYNVQSLMEEDGLYFLKCKLEDALEAKDIELAKVIGGEFKFYSEICGKKVVDIVNKRYLIENR